MRILFFNYEYPPLGGGAAYASQNILKVYSKLDNLEVDFITSSLDSNYHQETIGQNIKVHRLPIGKNENNYTYQSQKDLLVYAWKAYFFSKKLAEKAKQAAEPYSLTHSFFSVPCGFISLLLYYHFKLPYIVSLRGSDVPGYSERFSFLYNFLKPLIVFIWKKAGAVIANSSMLKDLALKSNQNQKIGIIYNGIDTEIFRPSEQPKDSHKFIILCASRLSRRKGFNYVIDAFYKISSKYPQAELIIAGGEGNAEKELKDQVKKFKLENKVSFTGLVTPNTEFLKYYQRADVFVFPSLNEGMSNNMLEAMASGLAVIMTPTGGAQELVKDGINGYLVKFKDSNDIAEKLERLINNLDLCRNMGWESRKIAQNLTWGSVAKKYYNLYEEVI
jgi:glycosyltransferase involved in cell wall biosynthesis